MSLPQEEFDLGCEEFTLACRKACEWKHIYYGAAYTTRLAQAVMELEIAIAAAKRLVERDYAPKVVG